MGHPVSGNHRGRVTPVAQDPGIIERVKTEFVQKRPEFEVRVGRGQSMVAGHHEQRIIQAALAAEPFRQPAETPVEGPVRLQGLVRERIGVMGILVHRGKHDGQEIRPVDRPVDVPPRRVVHGLPAAGVMAIEPVPVLGQQRLVLENTQSPVQKAEYPGRPFEILEDGADIFPEVPVHIEPARSDVTARLVEMGESVGL